MERVSYHANYQCLKDAAHDFIDVRQQRERHVFARNLGEGERDVLGLTFVMSPNIVLLDDRKARNEAKELGYMP